MTDMASANLPETDPLWAPGLVRRPRRGYDARYFVVPAKDVKAGYRPKTMTIPETKTEAEAAEMCRSWWQELLAWREGTGTRPPEYTFTWLSRRYRFDELSPFQTKTAGTQANYILECKEIERTIGARRFDPKLEGGVLIPRVVGEDIRRWHMEWGQRKKVTVAEDGTEIVDVIPTPSRARHMIMMLRNLVTYGVEIGAPGCSELRERLSAMKFPSPPARDKAPTYDQIDAFVNKAVEMGYRSQAITTLAQYELIERRAHIIGQWDNRGDQPVWLPGWVWSGVSTDWRIKYFQTKTERNLRDFDLKATQRLLSLMQETPKEARIGPIIICEGTGQPWRKRHYAEVWRKIARAAGIPDDVWSMDGRAGGATEADTIPEITDRMFDDAGGWADAETKNRYRRNKPRNAGKVIELRQAARAKEQK